MLMAKHRHNDLLSTFIRQYQEFEGYMEERPIAIDGQHLSIAAIVATARHLISVSLDDSPDVVNPVARSREIIDQSINDKKSVYGVSTGFGGSADTRTSNFEALGYALLQTLNAGVLPTSTPLKSILPLVDPLASTCMPESWVRAAILVRINSLIRGHSGVRWETIDKLKEMLTANIVPLVPIRASISASGDLAPLSYIAGALTGNPSLFVFDGPVTHGYRNIVSASEALNKHGLGTIKLQPKEHLSIVNGTAFSAALAALCLHDAVHLAILSQVCTAMGTEALLGERQNYDPFIHEVARPHPGQVQAARVIWGLLEGSRFARGDEAEHTIYEDAGELRQDRYPLRTAPQFLGPQIEDILAAVETVSVECNSTTDNPLVDADTQKVYNGGNFQAMAVTNSMEKTRMALQNIGKLLFSQSTELCNPAMNRGLPPSLAATDPSLDYHGKGLDIAMASYVSELGYLASPVSTHVQSAEMHNQAVNSLALISARATVNALDVLSMLTASYIYLLCQALDLRALQFEFYSEVGGIVREELHRHFSSLLAPADITCLLTTIMPKIRKSLDETAKMDAVPRMKQVASSSVDTLLDFISTHSNSPAGNILSAITGFRDSFALRASKSLDSLRSAFLRNGRGPAPASPYLKNTRPLYEFVRNTLGIKMHGIENLGGFSEGLGVQAVSTGENISRIHEAIRDGTTRGVIVNMF
ncbi:phenylalanine ammonia-lyase [Stereum hirsutum FP-91666 SS1]|uniref:phenylalanine ammonia-lyase n=1 Tax=Stereum hirsutum (strain FP-91666) TaxID=721885 RepID=UPI0004449612|nr:phenylalanine ammonia-lyase [Stereum hirsutum FP-91666 SS1]EIM82653.1 phenylalanine ammonia-lyase [Stereum hirsutum FP-91666 SS1]